MHHFCKHANRNCRPGALCTPCSGRGGVLKDGEGISVPLTMMDAVPREMAERAQRALAEVRQPANHHPQPVGDNGYAASVAEFDRAPAVAAQVADAMVPPETPADTPMVRNNQAAFDACYAAVANAKAQRDSARLSEQRRRFERDKAWQDHFREQHEARQAAIAADPRAAAYYAQFR